MMKIPDKEEVLSRVSQAKERRALRKALRTSAQNPNLLITITSTHFVQGGTARHKMAVNETEKEAITTTRIVDGKPLLMENDPDTPPAQLALLETEDFDYDEPPAAAFALPQLVGARAK